MKLKDKICLTIFIICLLFLMPFSLMISVIADNGNHKLSIILTLIFSGIWLGSLIFLGSDSNDK